MEHIHSFEGGMDRDTSAFKYPKNKYYEANNMRLTVDEETQQYSLTTIDGTELYFTNPSNHSYRGHCFVRTQLVLFLVDNSGITDLIVEIDPLSPTGVGDALDVTNTIYEGDLGLSAHSNYMTTSASYERDNVRKVYFSDGVNPLRVVDLDRDYSFHNPEDLNILPPPDHSSIEYTSIEESGQLSAGMVQYTYQLYKENGPETYFAPPSTILPITKGTVYSIANYRSNFYGGIKETHCNKSVRFEISSNISASKFDTIRVVGIYYEDLDIEPTIKVLGDYPFSDNTLEFLDTGSGYADEYTLSEFTALRRVFTAGSLANKYGHLLAADITEEVFDVDFDARAYRFANSGTYSGIAKVFETDGSYFLICRSGVIRPGAGGTAAAGDWVYYNSSDVYQSSHADYDQSGYGTDYGIPSDADAICPDNYLDEDFTAASYVQEDHFFYDGTTGITQGYVGGTGENVSYTITRDGLHEEYNDDSTTITSQFPLSGSDGFKRMYQYSTNSISTAAESSMLGTLDNYASPIRASINRSFQRDEIYRFGLIFTDTFGRTSYVKWIGDIRMPKTFDTYDNGAGGSINYALTDTNVSDHYLVNRLVVEFEIDNVSGSDIIGAQIVAVERTSSNSTVVDSGWLGSLEHVADGINSHNVTGYVFPSSLVNGQFGTTASTINTAVTTAGGIPSYESALSSTHKEYISPDINFNEGSAVTTPSKFYSYGVGTSTASTYSANALADYSLLHNTTYFKQYGTYTNTSYTSATFAEFDIEDFGVFSDTSYNAGNDALAYAFPLGGSYVYNYSKGGASYDVTGPSSNAGARGTCGIASGTAGSHYAGTWNPFLSLANTEALYVSRKNIIEPYGGLDYTSRQVSAYATVSPFIELSAGSATIEASGDTYIGMFEHVRTMVTNSTDLNDGDNNTEILYLPVESRYNVIARSNQCIYSGFFTQNMLLGIKETIGIWPADADGTTTFAQTSYLYDYNNTYNRIADYKLFYEAPANYVYGESKRYDTKIIASEEKANGELIDSWTKFLFANEIELKTAHGPITNIDLVGDNLIAIQEKAVASVAVYDREQIVGDSGSSLALGTGGILDRYEYISTTIGCQSKKGHVVSPTGLYLYDGFNNGIYALSAKGEPSLSRAASMDSFFKTIKEAGFSFVAAGYDRQHNDVLFTFNILSPLGQRTLAFNDVRGFFTHFTDTSRQNYVYDDRVLMFGDTSAANNTFYLANSQDSLTIDGDAFDCSFTIISRPEHPELSRFDYLEWNSVVKTISTEAEEASTTFNTLQSENTYQDTGTIASTSFKRRMRNWRVNSLRDNSTIRTALSPRLRSEWLKSTFSFTPSTNKIWVDVIKTIFHPNKV